MARGGLLPVKFPWDKFPFQALLVQFTQFMETDHKENCEYIDEYRIMRTLGSGYSAQVKLAVDLQGKSLAIKQYKHETSTLETLKEELKVMKELSHENLIRLIAVKENAVNKSAKGTVQTCFAIILEYAAGGELFDFVAETGKFSEKVTRTYFHQMMNGLHYMHDKGYAHRDIKPENLLLTSTFILKIADFGFSCLIRGHDGTGILKTKLGTEGYMAPEIATKSYDGRKTDIFAAGVILFIMYAGNPPFEKPTVTDPYYKLIKEKRYDVFWNAHSRKRLPTFFSESFKDLVQKMFAYIPGERPTIVEIAKHPWAKGAISSHQEIVDEFRERKKKMDLILEKRRNQKEYEQRRRNENIHNQGFNSRGNEELEDKEFMSIYNREKLREHTLHEDAEFSPDDIIVEGEYVFTVSQLKYFLATHSVPLQQAQVESEQLITEVSQLKCSQITDVSGKMQVQYKYEYEVQSQTVESSLLLSISFSPCPPKHLRLHFSLLQGNSFYFKRVVKDIRNNCFP